MAKTILLTVSLLSLAFSVSPVGIAEQPTPSVDLVRNEILALERAALDRWIKLDPQGYLDTYAPDVTYFDPTTDRRVDGRDAMQTRLAPIKNMKAPFTDPRYELIEPKLQRYGDVAILTFNAVTYGKMGDKPETVLSRWNSTEVYNRVGGKWRIIHSHWSYLKPEIKPLAF